jgi:outer membrane protein with beta-barrel domain
LNLHYIELPILYKYLINKKFSAEVGLAPGVFIKKKEEDNNSQNVSAMPFNAISLSFVAGLYYNINEKWRVNIRTNNSVLPIRPNINNNDLASRIFDDGQYNDLFSIGFQYTL